MKETNENNEIKETKSSKWIGKIIVITIVSLIILILGIISVIIVVNNTRNNDEQTEEEDLEFLLQEYEDSKRLTWELNKRIDEANPGEIDVESIELKDYIDAFSMLVAPNNFTQEEMAKLDEGLIKNINYIDIAMRIASMVNEEDPDKIDYGYVGEEALATALKVDVINKIISEFTGVTINGVLDTKDVRFAYDQETNQYYYNKYNHEVTPDIQKVIEAKEVGTIYVSYKVGYTNESDIANMEGFLDLKYYTVNLVLEKNSNYEYSKYKVLSIEIVE